MAGRSITVTFLGKDASLGRTLDGVEGKTSKLGDRMKKIGKAIAVGLGTAAIAGAVGLAKLTQGAIADEAAQKRLATTLKNTTGATDRQVAGVEKWISRQGELLGVTDDDLRPALQRLAEATGDVGEAQSLASLAMDVSAGTGKSLKTVSEALMKAQNGNVGALSRLGIETKNANGETLSFEQATAKMAETFKGQATKNAQTLQGKMDRLKLILSETGETIGAKMIPVVTKLADWLLNKGVPGAIAFGQSLIKVARFVDDNKVAIGALIVAMTALVAITKIHTAFLAVQAAGGLLKYLAATNLVTTATKVWTAVQWALNAAMRANPIGIVITVLAALVTGLVIAYKKSDKFRSVVDTALRAVGAAAKWLWNNAFSPAFGAIKKIIQVVGQAGIWLWNKALAPAFRAILKGVGWVLDGWAQMLRALAKVPGFEWAGRAADKLQRAADKARNVAGNIRDIPQNWNSDVRITYTFRRNGSPYTGPGTAPGFQQAHGTMNFPGGAAWVGEQGPELVSLPKGTRIWSAARSERMVDSMRGARDAGGSETIIVKLYLDGREIHQSLLKRKRTTGAPLGLT